MSVAQSNVHVDAETINALFNEFVNKKGGPRVSLDNGRIMVRVGGIAMALDGIQLGPEGFDLNFRVVR